MPFLLGGTDPANIAVRRPSSPAVHDAFSRTNEKRLETSTKCRPRLFFRKACPMLAFSAVVFASGYSLGSRRGVQTREAFASVERLSRGAARNNTTVRLGRRPDFDNGSARAFIENFRHALGSENMSSLIWPHVPVVPFVLRDGKLLCRSNHRDLLRESEGNLRRSADFAEMLRTVCDSHQDEVSSQRAGSGLPLLLINADGNGCDVKERSDVCGFPRLTWSLPSPKHGEGWCGAVPVTSYELWRAFGGRTRASWDSEFTEQARRFPWSSKIDRAVWRGSTTLNTILYGRARLGDTPRGALVRMGMENPESIDAAFVDFVGPYRSRESELRNQTVLSKRMKFDHFMKYKAVLDIDGNNWSSRFARLLCMNSVVIKIDPDFIESFHHELEPMVHYVPASLKNLSHVVAHVLNNKNKNEMKSIVDSANNWCRRTMTEGQLIKATKTQLESYENAFSFRMQNHITDENIIPDDVENDLIECVL